MEQNLVRGCCGNLEYRKMLSDDDADIPYLKKIYKSPEISQYLNISDNYFDYVTGTENVHFYKIHQNDILIGAIHLEIQGPTLFMSILVLPNFQKSGLGSSIIKDIKNDIFDLGYKNIEISVDEDNIASIALFEKAGFVRTSKNDELINFIYQRGKD